MTLDPEVTCVTVQEAPRRVADRACRTALASQRERAAENTADWLRNREGPGLSTGALSVTHVREGGS